MDERGDGIADARIDVHQWQIRKLYLHAVAGLAYALRLTLIEEPLGAGLTLSGAGRNEVAVRGGRQSRVGASKATCAYQVC